MKNTAKKVSIALKVTLSMYTLFIMLLFALTSLTILQTVLIFFSGIGLFTLLDGPLMAPLKNWVINKEIDYYNKKAELLQDAITRILNLGRKPFKIMDDGTAKLIKNQNEKTFIDFKIHQVYANDKAHAENIYKLFILPALKKQPHKKFFYVDKNTHNLKD